MGRISVADAMELSVAERILLVEDLWDTIAEAPESVRLTDAQREELSQRLDEYHRDPEAGRPWNEVKARILGKS